MEAYGMAGEGGRELRRYERCFGEMMRVIGVEKAKLNTEKANFDGLTRQLEGKLQQIRDYSSSLEGKVDSLAQLEATILQNKFRSHPTISVTEFLISHGIFTDGSSSIHDKLQEFTGAFYSFDLSNALKALTLEQTTSSSPETGLNLINAAISEITNHRFKVIDRESSLCFLSETVLFACGPTAKSCYVTDAECRIIPSEMKQARKFHGLVKFGERVYAFGGMKKSADDLKTWESFNLKGEVWDKSGKMQARRFANPAVIGNKIYLAGGYAKTPIEEFNPETELFRPINCPVPIRHCGIALSINNSLVVLSSDGVTHCSGDFEVISQTPMHRFPASLQLFSVVAPLWSGDKYYLLVTDGREHVKLTVRAEPTWHAEVSEVS